MTPRELLAQALRDSAAELLNDLQNHLDAHADAKQRLDRMRAEIVQVQQLFGPDTVHGDTWVLNHQTTKPFVGKLEALAMALRDEGREADALLVADAWRLLSSVAAIGAVPPSVDYEPDWIEAIHWVLYSEDGLGLGWLLDEQEEPCNADE